MIGSTHSLISNNSELNLISDNQPLSYEKYEKHIELIIQTYNTIEDFVFGPNK